MPSLLAGYFNFTKVHETVTFLVIVDPWIDEFVAFLLLK